jgi:aminoglycoside 6-adenylyltransferase
MFDWYDTPMHVHTDETIAAIVRWAAENDNVRAAILTSTRARPGSTPDRWSDYDVMLIVQDIDAMLADRSWIDTFGEVIVAYWDPFDSREDDFRWGGSVIQYAGSLKIDFSLWPVERLTGLTSIHPEFDAGYRVLLDKDGLTSRLPAPTYRAYRLEPPVEDRFAVVVNDFYVGVPYVVKCLLRDDPMPGRWVLDYDMRFVYLQPMLEWMSGVYSGWGGPVGVNGKGLNRTLPPEIWEAVARTFAPLDDEATWVALLTMCEVFRTCGEAVAAALGYTFDTALHDRVIAHAQWMRRHIEP